jgi:hypothetical protein
MYANQLNTGAPAYIVGFLAVAPLSMFALFAVIWVAVDWFDGEEIAPAVVAAPREDLAGDYARGIADDMRALDWLQDNWEDLENSAHLVELMTNEDWDQGAISSAVTMYEESGESWEDNGGPVAVFFDNDVLDIETLIKVSSHGPRDIHEVRALVTFGGPNCWVIANDGDNIKVQVNWGGDRAELAPYAPNVSGYLYELGDMMNEYAAS